jgi:hypothetical protein
MAFDWDALLRDHPELMADPAFQRAYRDLRRMQVDDYTDG